jgi:hypothetical protein
MATPRRAAMIVLQPKEEGEVRVRRSNGLEVMNKLKDDAMA